MRLRNKKTGQLGNFIINKDHFECVDLDYVPEYRSVAELSSEWEDASEEPKEYWYIENNGDIDKETYDGDVYEERMIEIGNYFETEEEAELAVRRLKAWKRLKDKGFRFKNNSLDICCHTINFKVDRQFDMTDETSRDLHLLFGGEE